MTWWLLVLILSILFASHHVHYVAAWTTNSGATKYTSMNMVETCDGSESSRRTFLSASATGFVLVVLPETSNAVTRAIGGAEEKCRAAGNCLEIGEWDGAVGWTWGGKDRCDATDRRCGPDGQLRDTVPSGDPVPEVTNKITHIVEMDFNIGRDESGTIRIGLYGDDSPSRVEQFLSLVTTGLRTISDSVFENGIGVLSVPVSINRGGVLGQIVPGQKLDFGIPSQSAAYARSRGLSKVGGEFMPQPRPKPMNADDPAVRKHDVAGLLSVPGKGIGFGGTGFETDDECFESSFQLTTQAVPSMDKEGRRVIGQVLDQESMANLARLASLPVKKGFKGVIPGQNSGPPLLAVRITGISAKVINASD